MKKQLLAAVAATTLTLSVPLPSAHAQDESVPRDQRFGRAVPARAYINREVVNQAGKNVGEVEDVIFDVESGRVLYVVLNPKGGAQGDMIAVPPRLFALPQPQPAGAAKTRRPLTIRANEQALAGAPKLAATGEELAQGAYANKVYTHFNQPRWWEGAAGADAGKFNHVRRASAVTKFAVQNPSNEKLGQIETVLFDIPAGRVSYFILDPAQNVVNKQLLVPIPPMAFTRGQESHTLILDADKEKFNSAPRINRDDLTAEDIQKLSNPEFATKVYNHYGKQPWFQNEGILSPTGPDRDNDRNRNNNRNDRSERDNDNDLRSAQAQNEQVPRDQHFGRAVPARAYINREVVNQAGKNVGEVEDVIFDVESGRVLYVALNPKGGAQGDMIAVPPRLFALPQPQAAGAAKTRRPLTIRANEQALAGAPKLAATGEELSQGAYANKVYTHFNQPRWWEGAAGADPGKFNHVRRASNLAKFAVQNPSNEKLGQIETVLFDIPAGRVSYFILDPDQSVVNKELLVPIPPMAFTRGQENRTLILDANKEKLNNAPRVNRDDLTAEDIEKLSNPAFATKVYNHYGKQPWFQNEGILSPTGPDRDNNRNRNNNRNDRNNDRDND